MPNINDPIIDFNDFNAEPQLLRDIQDGKAIAFYSFAHLLLDTSGKPYTLPTGLYISGAYDTLRQLQSAFPTGNTNLYIVNADKYIYYWNGSTWTKGGTIDATYAFGVELQVPNTATNGTLTQEQFNQLSNNENAYILFNNERYLLMDKGHEADTWGYSHLGADITGAKIKVITINTSNRSWVLTDEEFVKDGTISAQKIQDGAVTTQKLSSDVILQIRKNDFASRFNSDRLNILEAQINADKNTIEYTSDKPLEITCNGANIIDCNARFKKVEGQTRRYSLNLLSENKLGTSNCTYSDGVYTFTNVANLELFRDSNIKGDITIGLILLKKPVKSTSFTFYNGTINDNNIGFDNIQGYELNKTYTVNFNIDKSFLTMVWGNENNEEVQFKMWIVKGRYTAETIPPFQPYDNTLVNSKATFASTGRNLFNPQTDINTNKLSAVGDVILHTMRYGGLVFSKVLPKGQYTLTIDIVELGDLSGDTSFILYESGNEIGHLYFRKPTHTQTSSATFNITQDLATLNVTQWWQQADQNNTIKFKVTLKRGTDKSYEPYIKNISQYDIELGAYDYIENGNLIKQTSEMVTLNGSENWQIEGISPTKRFLTYDKVPDLIFDNSAINVLTNSNLKSVTAGSTWNIKIDSISGSSGTLHIASTSITTVEQLKVWLKANPITLVYKKTTPTITPIVVPNGIVSYKNGLTSQEIKGKYLPYKYTAKYVNGGQQ